MSPDDQPVEVESLVHPKYDHVPPEVGDAAGADEVDEADEIGAVTAGLEKSELRYDPPHRVDESPAQGELH